MKLAEVRKLLDAGLAEEGLKQVRLPDLQKKVWAHPEGELTRFFAEHVVRWSTSFSLGGIIAVDVPPLREWLNKHRPGEASGIFRSYFVGYHTANDNLLCGSFAPLCGPVPVHLWAGLVRDRLDSIPDNLTDLLAAYRSNREVLGWLGAPLEAEAWSFLQRWRADPDPSLYVPRRAPDGRIV